MKSSDAVETGIVSPDTATPEFGSSAQKQQNSISDNAPLLIGVIVGLTVFSITIVAAAIKYRRDTLRYYPWTDGEMIKSSAKSHAPVRSDTFVSSSSDGDERTRSWTDWVSEVESELSVIEEGRVVFDSLPRSRSAELEGIAQFVPRSDSPPPHPHPHEQMVSKSKIATMYSCINNGSASTSINKYDRTCY